MADRPTRIEIVGNELCLVWPDGAESYFPAPFLREHSPSASNQGETDVLGRQHGGQGPKKFPNVRIQGWEPVGNYAIRPHFSDGHATGLYSWDYLRELHDKMEAE